MKNIIIFTILTLCFSCKTEDPLSAYSSYGVFKDIYPLKDSVTVDLRTNDSLSVETNKGIVWVKVIGISVICYKGIKSISCPDAGIGTAFQLRFNNEIQRFYYGLDDYTSSYQDRYPLRSCINSSPIVTDNSTHLRLITIGNMNIQFRNIYPSPASDTEHKNLLATNGYHVTLTFQKRCF